MIEDPSDQPGLREEGEKGNDRPSGTRWQSHDLGNPTDAKGLEEEGGRGGGEWKRHTSDGALKNWCSRVGSTPDIQRRKRRDGKGEREREMRGRGAGGRRWWNTMTGDPPLLFSRSWRRNFKDPHRGQKHSLGPLIITTGVSLFGRDALSRVQNCSAGVPRAKPPLPPPLGIAPLSSFPLYILPSSHDRVDRPTNIFFSLYQFPSIRPTFINIFVRAPPWKPSRSQHNQEVRRNSNDEI